MTENEAINELQANIDLPFGFTVSDEVSEIAIQALEEIQQYRAIGTVEGCEKAMDFELARQDKSLAEVIDEYLKYIKIGTIEEFKDLKEKEERFDRNITMFNSIGLEIRNKAIDEFMKQVEVEYDNDACPGVTDWMDYKISIRDLFRIAEEMRGAE